jgi:hypothetical protein
MNNHSNQSPPVHFSLLESDQESDANINNPKVSTSKPMFQIQPQERKSRFWRRKRNKRDRESNILKTDILGQDMTDAGGKKKGWFGFGW